MSVEPGECDIVARYLKRHDFPKGKYKLRGVGRVHPTHSGRNVTHRPHPMLQSSRIASAFGGLVLLGHIVSFFSLRPSPVQPDWMSSMIMPTPLFLSLAVVVGIAGQQIVYVHFRKIPHRHPPLLVLVIIFIFIFIFVLFLPSFVGFIVSRPRTILFIGCWAGLVDFSSLISWLYSYPIYCLSLFFYYVAW